MDQEPCLRLNLGQGAYHKWQKTKVDPGSQPMGRTRMGWRHFVIGQDYVQRRLAGGEEILVVQVSPGFVRDALG